MKVGGGLSFLFRHFGVVDEYESYRYTHEPIESLAITLFIFRSKLK